MKNTLLLLCLLCTSLIQAQDKDLAKITKYYTSGNFDKVVKLCDKTLSSPQNKKNPKIYFYKSLSVFKLSDSSSATYFKDVTNCISIASKGVPYDKKLEIFNKRDTDFGALIQAAHKQAEIKYYTNKLKEAKTLEGTMVRTFKDTSEIYYVLFNIVRNKEVNNTEKLLVIDLKQNAGKIDSLIYFASLNVGKPYKYAKEGPDAFDCSGFIGYVFKNFGEKLPHNANMIAKLGEEVKLEDIQKGDLIFFGTTSAYHVAMYIAEKGKEPKIIHCVSRGVCIDDFTATTHWGKSNVYKVKRLIK